MHVWHLGDIPGAWSVPDLPWCLGWNNGTKHPVAVARWILWDMWGPGSTPRKSHHVQWTRLCLGWVRSTGAKNKPSPMGPMGYETGTTLHPWSINHHPFTMFDQSTIIHLLCLMPVSYASRTFVFTPYWNQKERCADLDAFVTPPVSTSTFFIMFTFWCDKDRIPGSWSLIIITMKKTSWPAADTVLQLLRCQEQCGSILWAG